MKGRTGEDLVEKQNAEMGQMPVVAEEHAAYGYTNENRHFVRAFLGKEKPRLTFADGVEVVRLLMTAYQSAEQGKTLSFPPAGLDTLRAQGGPGYLENLTGCGTWECGKETRFERICPGVQLASSPESAFRSALSLFSARSASQQLGTITFETSGKASAQPDFIRGVLYLHSFEYDEAAEAFRAAQKVDPDFVLAYWGEAMTYTHPVWNEQDLSAARAALARLAPPRRRAREGGDGARAGCLDAVEVLYGEGPKPRRDTLYATAMEGVAPSSRMTKRRCLHSLALMG